MVGQPCAAGCAEPLRPRHPGDRASREVSRFPNGGDCRDGDAEPLLERPQDFGICDGPHLLSCAVIPVTLITHLCLGAP